MARLIGRWLLSATTIACGGRATSELATRTPLPASSFVLTSPAFVANGELPPEFSCAGGGREPSLWWSGIPASAKSLAIAMEELDPKSGRAVHWLVAGIASSESRTVPRCDEQVAVSSTTFEPKQDCSIHDIAQWTGLNDWNELGWHPPCASDARHSYRFTVIALDQMIGYPRITRSALLELAAGHVVATQTIDVTLRADHH